MSPLMDDRVLVYDSTRCTGCRYCESACALSHHSQLDFELSNLKINTNLGFNDKERSSHLVFSASYCIHCDPAPCQIVCSTGAIQKEYNGRVFLNELKCIGCRSCTLVCSLSVAWFLPETHQSNKCDLCDGDPQCVDVCSVDAISFLQRSIVREKLRENWRNKTW